MVAEFIRYYNYKASDVLVEYARTFFSLMNEKIKLESKERVNLIENMTIGNGSHPNGESVVKKLIENAEGTEQFIKAAKLLREIKDV